MPRIVRYNRVECRGTLKRSEADTITETHVIVTDEAVSLTWIAQHSSTPKLNRSVKGQPGYFWDSIEPTQKGKLEWSLQCTGSPQQFTQLPDSPLAVPAAISVGSELVEEPTLVDYRNRAITTTAGEIIAGMTRERPLLVYNVTKNLASDPEWLETHPGAVNNDAVRLRGRMRAAGTLMLRGISLSEYRIENGDTFTTCSFALHYDPAGWIKRILNVGTRQLVEFRTDKGKKAWRQERIKAGTPSQYIDEPVPLDRKGKVLDGVLDANSDTPIDPSKLVFLEYNVQPLLPFSSVLPLT